MISKQKEEERKEMGTPKPVARAAGFGVCLDVPAVETPVNPQ